MMLVGFKPVTAVPVNWEPNFGQNLNLGDDDSQSVNLGFAFPFQGSSYSSVHVSSNGFISVGGDNGHGCCDGVLNGDPSFPGFLDGFGRIAPAWFDMVAEFGGSDNVYLNASADRAVITWNNMLEWGESGRNTFQVQLLADGTIIFSYLALSDATLLLHNALIGITQGGGPIDPGELNLLSGLEFSNTGTQYMFLTPGSSFNLNNASIVFAGPVAASQDPGGGSGGGQAPPTPGGDEVPEPGTIGLSIIGLAGCIALARRRFDD
jgi:hypothetical protein